MDMQEDCKHGFANRVFGGFGNLQASARVSLIGDDRQEDSLDNRSCLDATA